jgi:hypothetical protein
MANRVVVVDGGAGSADATPVRDSTQLVTAVTAASVLANMSNGLSKSATPPCAGIIDIARQLRYFPRVLLSTDKRRGK